MISSVNRIHIVGGAGSGKTYAAMQLSRHLGFQTLNLDSIYWDDSDDAYDKRSSPEIRNQKLQQVVSAEKWIVEGAYYAWLSGSFRRADVIYILTPGLATCTIRIIIRFLKRKIGILKASKRETLRGLYALLKWNREYNRIELAKIQTFLAPYKDKVRKCQSPDQILNEIVGDNASPLL